MFVCIFVFSFCFSAGGVGGKGKMEASSVSDDVSVAKKEMEMPRRSVSGSWKFVLDYMYGDTMRRWVSLVVNVLVVLVTVFFLITLRGVSAKTPAVFMRLAEKTVGETDVSIKTNADWMNVDESVRQADVNRRLNATGLLLRSTDIRKEISRKDETFSAKNVGLEGLASRSYYPGTIKAKQNPENSASVTILVYNDAHERAMNLGRTWKERELNELEAHVSMFVSHPPLQ